MNDKILDNFHWKYIEKPQWVKTWLNRTSEMPTKHIMTRAEAIAKLSEAMIGYHSVEKTIDFYIEAGILEIKEEELPGLPIGFEFPLSKRDEWTNCVNEMFKQGFEVKKK